MDDEGTGKPRQAYSDIKQAEQDCLDAKDLLLKFGVEEDNIHLLVNPSETTVKKLYMTILRKLVAGRKKSPQEQFLCIHVFAGHGV